jgi:limonene-1,2-epoxide hydrolase
MMDPETNAMQIVESYFRNWGPTSQLFWESFDRYFDEKTVWENVGLGKTVGRAEAIAFAKSFPLEFDHMRVEQLRMSASGNVVYNERVDHFCSADGTPVLTIRIAGVIEVGEDGRLKYFRDYFDTAKVFADLAAVTAV